MRNDLRTNVKKMIGSEVMVEDVTRVELWLQFEANDSVGRMILQTWWKGINGS